jgi:hypothetical protein
MFEVGSLRVDMGNPSFIVSFYSTRKNEKGLR